MGQPLLPMMFGTDDHTFLCLTLHDFAVSIVEDKENLEFFCEFAFPTSLASREKIACGEFLEKFSQEREDFDCVGLLKTQGFAKDRSLVVVDPATEIVNPVEEIVDPATEFVKPTEEFLDSLRQCPEAEARYMEDQPDVEGEVKKHLFR